MTDHCMRAAKSFWNALRQRQMLTVAPLAIDPSVPLALSAALAHAKGPKPDVLLNPFVRDDFCVGAGNWS